MIRPSGGKKYFLLLQSNVILDSISLTFPLNPAFALFPKGLSRTQTWCNDSSQETKSQLLSPVLSPTPLLTWSLTTFPPPLPPHHRCFHSTQTKPVAASWTHLTFSQLYATACAISSARKPSPTHPTVSPQQTSTDVLTLLQCSFLLSFLDLPGRISASFLLWLATLITLLGMTPEKQRPGTQKSLNKIWWMNEFFSLQLDPWFLMLEVQ